MVTSILAGAAIWLSITAGCDAPVDSIPIFPNNYNPIYVCGITPLPVCGVSYKLTSPDDVTITYRFNQFVRPGFEYNQGFPIPSHMYATGVDWGWTVIPAVNWPAPAAMLDMFTVTTPTVSSVEVQPNSELVFDSVKWETSCLNLLSVPGSGILPAPQSMKLKK